MLGFARVPGPPLSPFVALLWYQEVLPGQFGPELVLPSGKAELVIELGPTDQVAATGTVCGPHSTYFHLERPKVAHAIVGVHFRPGGIRRFLSVPGRCSISELHNWIVTLEDLWGQHAIWLHDQLMEATTISDRLQIMERELERRLLRVEGSNQAVIAAVNLLQSVVSRRPVDDVANQLGYSSRRIQQHFRDEVGLSPKVFHRVSRFQKAIQMIDGSSTIDWSNIALTHGYFDQAHLVNDFRTFTSLSPTAYLAHRTARLGHLNDTGLDTATNA